MTRSLTIVGASARAAAQSALRAGFAVRAGDLFADVDLCKISDATRVIEYPRGLARILRGSRPGGWMYTGALENHPATVRRLARIRPLLGNSADVLARVRDPVTVAATLRAAGLLSPDVIRGDGDSPRDGSWLRKPFRSAGGARISLWDANAQTEPGTAGDYFFQRYVDGLPCSAIYLAADRRALLLGVSRQLIGAAWIGASGFGYCGSIGPLALSSDVAADFARVGAVLADRFDLVGLFGVDAIVNQQGVWPVEVNPRYTASSELLDRACGISTVDLHVTACEWRRLPDSSPPARQVVCGKAIVFATTSTVIANDLGQPLHTGVMHADGDPNWPAIADIPAPDTRIEPGWPIVTVLAEADDERQLLDKLRDQAAKVLAAVAN